MNKEYKSGKSSKNQAELYGETKELSIRYLITRDLGPWLSKLRGKEALDYGVGLGFSIDYLLSQGFNVKGVDINPHMIEEAQKRHPTVEISLTTPGKLPFQNKTFDLVLSWWVLFELSSIEEMSLYLREGKRVLKDDGLLIAMVANSEAYKPGYKSTLYDFNFPENKNAKSGDLVKMRYNEINLAFTDYLWLAEDYRVAFESAGLEICAMHYPLGKAGEGYPWQDEMTMSLALVIIAKPKSSIS
jgi:ubiquinone/menaquinone biosynthesis C-methylase UbiE